MTTSVFIRNDSPADNVNGHLVFVGAKQHGHSHVHSVAAAPLKPGETVTTTVWAAADRVIREVPVE